MEAIIIDAGEGHVGLMPCLLWSSMCLDINSNALEQDAFLNDKILEKSFKIIADHFEKAMDLSQNQDGGLTFPSVVLLNQVINYLDLKSVSSEVLAAEASEQHLLRHLSLLPDNFRDYVQKLAYRYDQLELRDSMHFMTKSFGVDVAKEVVQGIKSHQLHHPPAADKHLKILRYNPLYNGYHLLLHTEQGSTSHLISLDHKDSYLTDASTRTMFSHVRTLQLEQLCRIEGISFHSLDWAQCLIAYKETPSQEKFREVLV